MDKSSELPLLLFLPLCLCIRVSKKILSKFLRHFALSFRAWKV